MSVRPPFVDAHLHLWDRDGLRYPWLDDPGNAAIAPSYGIADYRAETAAWNVVGCVHVDAGAHAEDGERETQWLSGVADADGWPSGIVARVALEQPEAEWRLAWQAEQPRVVGIRHLINWHPSDASRRAYERDLTTDDRWRAGYALLARFGFSYDFHGFPPQLAGLAEVAARHDDVPVIVNHLALPILKDGLDQWRAGLAALAALPHVAIKLSGAGFIGDRTRIGDIVTEMIDRFGTNRVMIATNFPTDRLFASLDATLHTYEALLASFSEDERGEIWGRNANRLYRLDLDL